MVSTLRSGYEYNSNLFPDFRVQASARLWGITPSWIHAGHHMASAHVFERETTACTVGVGARRLLILRISVAGKPMITCIPSDEHANFFWMVTESRGCCVERAISLRPSISCLCQQKGSQTARADNLSTGAHVTFLPPCCHPPPPPTFVTFLC